MHNQGNICKIAGRIALFFFHPNTMDIFQYFGQSFEKKKTNLPPFLGVLKKHNVDYTKFETTCELLNFCVNFNLTIMCS